MCEWTSAFFQFSLYVDIFFYFKIRFVSRSFLNGFYYKSLLFAFQMDTLLHTIINKTICYA